MKKSLTDKQKIRRIEKMIQFAGVRLQRRFPILARQNAIGMTIFLGSITAMVASSAAWFLGYVPFWATILINAVAASLLHELEHDMIHSMYFKDRWPEKLMMYGVWIFRGNTPNPFYRKKIHLLHHRESGQFTDVEEQMIGNGMKYGIKRFFVMIDQNLAFLLNARMIRRTSPTFRPREMVHAAFPVYSLFSALWQLFLLTNIVYFAADFAGASFIKADWFTTVRQVLNAVAVVWLLPNFIRQGSLQFISSSMHYFGDIKPGYEGVIQQTQILTKWYLLPFQLFCFNFGGTHAIHHFVVTQPFYLRQMTTPLVHPVLAKYGVRFNDTGTFRRANRYSRAAAA